MKLKKIIALLVGCGAILTALAVVDGLAPQPVAVKQNRQVKPPVSVLEVTPADHASSLSLLATTTARWPIQLKVSSSAQLAWLNPAIEPGVLVKKGTQLARLHTSVLESHMAQANSAVKQAELNLKQALHEQTVALKMLSPANSSSFARREPQVSAAKAELTQARLAYTSAEKLLAEADIVAPYDAVIMHRHISPNEWLEAGQVAFDLAASDALDIHLPVSELNWTQVQSVLDKTDIQVRNRDGNQWSARVRYVAPQVDPVTRQRQVVLAVSQPYLAEPRLLPNQQVKVIISLGKQPDIAILPQSAITRDGYVWTLDEDNCLQKEWIQLVEQSRHQVYARFKHDSAKTRQVVVYPLLSMLPGKQVSPQAMEVLIAKQESHP